MVPLKDDSLKITLLNVHSLNIELKKLPLWISQFSKVILLISESINSSRLESNLYLPLIVFDRWISFRKSSSFLKFDMNQDTKLIYLTSAHV